MDGPRAARPDELAAIVALCDAAFRGPPYSTSMGDDFPLLFSAANASDLRVIAGSDGAVLAHAALLRADGLILGACVPMAALGAVTTRVDMRDRGLATAVVADAFRRLAEDGVAVVTISGDRGLYLRAGATRAGSCLRWSVRAADAAALSDPALRLRPAEDAAELIDLHLREPVRRRRDPGVFAAQGYARSIGCRSSAWVVEAGGRPVAYWIAGVPDRGPRPRDRSYGIEFAGERGALAGTIAALLARTATRRLILSTADPGWEGYLRRAGLQPEARPLPGTVAVLRPDVLVSAAGPLWAEREGGSWELFSVGPDRVLTGPRGPVRLGSDLTAAFFGRPGQVRDPALPAPLPLPWPNGLDYS